MANREEILKKSNTELKKLSDEELSAKLKVISEELGKDYLSMDEIIAERKAARDSKNWDAADKIRTALDKAGIVLKDSKEGTTWEIK